jgi:serine/threonine protein kinase
MSPEIIMNKSYDEKCDVYSFGIVMFELFFQRPPFYSGKGVNVSIALDITRGRRPEISDEEIHHLNQVEVRYVDVMKKCWESDPQNRPSFEQVYDEICEIQTMNNRMMYTEV